MINIGKSFTQEMTVQHKDTAVVYGSGKLEVYATPAMVGFMENTSMRCLDGLLEEGSDTVGVEINVKHLKATLVGKTVSCTATITEVDGRRIRFEVEARDETGVIGTAVHDRFIVHVEKFLSKLS
ncbi:thioesterase family protein [Odoribacter sp. OttesenSCG-928-G04]|nr:thioesterase family protein [Odoribacter sp. OttesenSCG-928-G04]MDL2331134.1 thioesterase family protein [Odoribacter sp. OttesenSCG-928-A06]